MVNVQTTTTLDHNIKESLVKHGISYKNCLEYGALFLLAEYGVGNHPNSKLKQKYEDKIDRLLNRITELMGNG